MVFAASLILADQVVGLESTAHDIDIKKQNLIKRIKNLETKLENLKQQLIDLSNIKPTKNGTFDKKAFKSYKKKYHIS